MCGLFVGYEGVKHLAPVDDLTLILSVDNMESA